MDTKQWPAWPTWPRRVWHGAVRGALIAAVIGVAGLGLYLWAPDDFGGTPRILAAVAAGVFAFHVMIMLLAPLGRSRAGRLAAGAAAGAVLGLVSGRILAASPQARERAAPTGCSVAWRSGWCWGGGSSTGCTTTRNAA